MKNHTTAQALEENRKMEKQLSELDSEFEKAGLTPELQATIAFMLGDRPTGGPYDLRIQDGARHLTNKEYQLHFTLVEIPKEADNDLIVFEGEVHPDQISKYQELSAKRAKLLTELHQVQTQSSVLETVSGLKTNTEVFSDMDIRETPRGKMCYDPNLKSIDLYGCPICGAIFYGGGNALHYADHECHNSGYETTIYFFGPKLVDKLISASREYNDPEWRMALTPLDMPTLTDYYPELIAEYDKNKQKNI